MIVQQESPTGLAAEIFVRHPANPILTAEDWPYRVNAVFNPGAALVDGEIDGRLIWTNLLNLHRAYLT